MIKDGFFVGFFVGWVIKEDGSVWIGCLELSSMSYFAKLLGKQKFVYK